MPTYSAATPPVLSALALEPTWIPLEKQVAGDEPWLIPLALPARLDGLVATGRASTNLVPLVPGTGAGTTGLAAVRAGCRFLGIERDASYVDLAARRLRAAELIPASEGA